MQEEAVERRLREPSSPSRPGAAGDAAGAASDVDARGRAKEERAILCAACRHEVTRDRESVAVDGASEHEFMNPTGIRFVVACFARAPGVTGVGGWDGVWTWFPGYAWSVVVCAACGAHLGWAFAKGEATTPSFFALIVDRLIAR